MPISDEVIELAPVKKTKTTLIIMFSIMGVLFALAVTFLILYFLKPSATQSSGEVTDVAVSGSSQLFSTTDKDGNRIQIAAVGNTYTVFVKLGVTGDIEPNVDWQAEPSKDAITIIRTGRGNRIDERLADGDVETGAAEDEYFCTFTPNESYADREVTLKAISKNKVAEVKFTIVKQGTEKIEFDYYRRGSSNVKLDIPEDNSLALPYYTVGKNNENFYIYYKQLGALDPETGLRSDIITRVEDSQENNILNAVSVESSNKNVVDIKQNLSIDRFGIAVNGPGEAEITVKANINKDFGDKSVEAKLKVKVTSTATLRYIEGIYFSPQPVTEEFYKTQDASKLTSSSPCFTDTFKLPYGKTTPYDNILSHIVIVPFEVQYQRGKDGAPGKLLTDWYDWIKLETSDKNVCDIQPGALSGKNKYALRAGTLASGLDCTLTISDNTPQSIGASAMVKVNVVAASSSSIALSTSAASYTQDQIDAANAKGGLNTAQGVEYNLTVSYAISTPGAVTDVNKMFENGYLSDGFEIKMSNPKFMTVRLGDTAIEQGKTYKFTDKTMTVKRNTDTSYTGTAKLTLTVGNNLADGDYSFTFVKKGTSIDGANSVNALDAEKESVVKFKLSGVASKAMFVSAEKALELITDGGKRAGGFTVSGSEAYMYMQNMERGVFNDEKVRDDDVPLFKLTRLITDNLEESTGGNSKIDIRDTISFLSNKEYLGGTAQGSSATLSFRNKALDPDDEGELQATVTFVVRTADDSHRALGTFKIHIYLINAINKISCSSAQSETLPYGADSATFKSLPSGTITATYAHGAAAALQPADLAKIEVGIKYFSNNELIDLYSTKGANDITNYKLGENGVVLFSCNNGTVKQEADLFVEGYKANVVLDDIYVYYTLPAQVAGKNGATYTRPALTCYRNFDFVRIADDAALYTDNKYLTEVTHDVAPNADDYVYSRNQLTPGCEIFVSAIVDPAPATGEPIVVKRESGSKQLAAVDVVYFTVPISGVYDSDTYRGTEVEYSTSTHKAFTNIRFTAAGSESSSSGYVVYSSGSHKVSYRILNQARPVATMGFYTDENCNVELDKLTFGKFGSDTAGASPYIKSFYIKATYGAPLIEDGKSKYNSFAALVIKLPDYLTYRVGDSGEFALGSSVSLVAPGGEDDANLKNAGYVYTRQVFLKLREDEEEYKVINHEDEDSETAITLSSNGLGDKQFYALVKAGLDKLKYTVDSQEIEQTAGVIKDLRFEVSGKNAATAPSIEIPFTVTPLKNSVYSMLSYNAEDCLKITGSMTGISIVPNVSGKKLTVSVNMSALRNINGEELTVTFSDRTRYGASSETVDKDFVVKFKIYVTVGLYKAEINETLSYVTDGTDGYTTNALTLKYNDGDSTLQPTEEMKGYIKVYAAHKDGAKIIGNASSVATDKMVVPAGTKNLLISNKLYTHLVGGVAEYYVLVEYDDGVNTPVRMYFEPVVITTTAESVRLKDNDDLGTDSSLNPVSKTASVTVTDGSTEYKLPAEVYNLGTGAATSGDINYYLYSSANRTTADKISCSKDGTPSAIAVIDANGMFKILDPESITGNKLYYRACHTDIGGNEIHIDIDITFTVTVNSVTLDAINGVLDSSDHITLYFKDVNNYTYVDLTGKVTASTAFDTIAIPAGTTYSVERVEGKSAALNTGTGLDIKPVASSASAQEILVKATYGSTTVSKKYYVDIVTLVAPTFAANGTVNVVTEVDKTTGVTAVSAAPTVTAYADAMTYAVTYAPVDKYITVNSSTGIISVNRTGSGLTAGQLLNTADYSAGNAHKIKTTVTYTVDGTKYAGSTFGSFTYVNAADYSLNLTWSGYTPQFKLVKVDGVTVTDAANPVVYAEADKNKYFIELVEDSAAWFKVEDWTYSLTSGNTGISNVMPSFTKVGDKYRAQLNSLGSGFGTLGITVAASAYGNRGATATNAYSITDPMGSVTTSLGGFATGKWNDTSKQYKIDYTKIDDTDATPLTFEYIIDATGVGAVTVNTTDINIITTVTDCVTVNTGITRIGTDNKFKITYNALKPIDKFTITGTINVNGRKYFLDAKELNLVATEPMFGLDVTGGDTIRPEQTSVLNVSKTSNEFLGAYTIAYSVSGDTSLLTGGAGVAALGTTGDDTTNRYTLTPLKTITNSGKVTVTATITVSDGVFAGSTYTLTKVINIVGVPMPTITWGGDINTNPGPGTVTLTGKYSAQNVSAGGKTYAFTTSEPTFAITADAGFTETTDYTFDTSTGVLVINDTENTKAGGKFIVTVTAKLTNADGVHNGETVTSEQLVIIVKPRAVTGAVSVTGQKNKTDIASAVSPVLGTSATQIVTGDSYTVTYTIDETGISGEDLDEFRAKYGVEGHLFVVKKSVLAEETVKLNAKIKVLKGAYAGEEIKTTVTVTVYGFSVTGPAAGISWNTETNKYNTYDIRAAVADALGDGTTPATLTSLGVNTVAYGAFVTLSAANVASFASDITIAAGDDVVVTYNAIAVADGITYYGEGSVTVKTFMPDIRLTFNGMEFASGDTVDMSAHSSVTVSVSETHGLNVTKFEFTDLGTALSAVSSGQNAILTAVDTTSEVTKTIKITYALESLTDVEVSLTVKIAPKASNDAYTISNRVVTLVDNQYNRNFRTEWIANTNNNLYGRELVVTFNIDLSKPWWEGGGQYPLGDFFDSGSSNFGAYNADGSEIFHSDFTTLKKNSACVENRYSQTYTIDLNTAISGNRHQVQFYAIAFNLKFKKSWSNPRISVSYRTAKSNDAGATIIVNDADYQITFDGRNYEAPAEYGGEYIVTFDANSGKFTGDATTATKKQTSNKIDCTYVVPKNYPTRDGYNFAGWANLAPGRNYTLTGVSDGSETSTTLLTAYTCSTHTLHALWEPKVYSVSINGNGATSACPHHIDVTCDATFTEGSLYATSNATVSSGSSLPILTRTGYNFAGWTNNAGETVSNTTKITTNYDGNTVTANWKPKTVNVTLNADGGVISSDTNIISATYDDKYTNLAGITATKLGYVFAGWWTMDDTPVQLTDGAGVLKLESGEYIKVNKETAFTIKAHWTAASYTVTLDEQGGVFGSGAVSSFTASYRQAYGTKLVGKDKIAKTGYVFDGWYTGANGTGVRVTDSDGNVVAGDNGKVNVAAAHSLYANWVENNAIAITLDPGIGAAMSVTGAPSNYDSTDKQLTVTYGGKYTNLDSIAATKTGYTFGGWWTGTGGTGTRITSSSKVDVTGATLYAKWTAATYEVSFNTKGGNTISTKVTVTYAGTYGALPTPVKAGHRFVGWSLTDGGSAMAAGAAVNTAANHTLYAVWVEQITITYNANGGSFAGGSTTYVITVDKGSAFDGAPAGLPAISRDGYDKASGWYAATDGNTTVSGNKDANTVVYAHWTAKTVTVSFDGDGATVSGTIKVKFDADYTAVESTSIPTKPTKTGYTFGGWMTADGRLAINGSNAVQTGVKVTNSSNHTLKAVWTLDTYTITYNADGGEGVSNSTYNVNMSLTLPTPTKTGYTFEGWHAVNTLDDTKVTAIATGTTGNKVYYAKWTLATYNITYMDGNTVLALTPATYNYDAAATLPSISAGTAPTKTGYTFAGWYDNSGLTGTAVTEIAANTTGDKTYYAKWTPVGYTIKYNNGTSDITVAGAATSYDIESADITLPAAPGFSKTGYDFVGWYLSGDAEETVVTKIPAGSTGDKTLMAKWTLTKYTITYKDGNTQLTGLAPYEYTADNGATLPAYAKTGYNFLGWFVHVGDAVDGAETGTAVTAIAANVTGNKVYYAKWEPITYTITYLDGNTVLTALGDTYDCSTTKTLATTATKTGYTFAGWYDNSGLTGTAVTAIAAGTATGNKTYYAKWTAKKVAVTVNGGTAQNIDYGSAYSAITKDAGATGLAYGTTIVTDFTTLIDVAHGVEVTGSGDSATYSLTLKAARTITIDANGGTFGAGGVSQMTVPNVIDGTALSSVPGTVIVYSTNPVKEGYANGGKWYYGSDVEVDNNVKTSDAVTRCYLKWTAATVNVFIDLDGGTYASGVTATSTVTYDTAYSGITRPVKTGYDFAGWKYGDTTVTDDSTLVNVSNGVSHVGYSYMLTLKALWTVHTYGITYYDGTELDTTGLTALGIGSAPTSYKITDATITLPNPSKTDYDFVGWYDNSSFTGSAVTTILTGSVGDKAFYAKFVPHVAPTTVDVTIHDIGLTTTITAGGTVAALGMAPTKTGYTFVGWYKHEGDLEAGNVTGDAYTASTAINEDTVLFAEWEESVYAVSFVTNGGTITAGEITSYTFGTGATLPTAVSKTGYGFAGWYDNAALTGTPVTAIGADAVGNKVYWAAWGTVTITTVKVDGVHENIYLLVRSSGGSFDTANGYFLAYDVDPMGEQYKLTIELQENDEITIYAPGYGSNKYCTKLGGDNIGGRLTEKTGYIKVNTAGTYTFYYKPGDPNTIYIGD